MSELRQRFENLNSHDVVLEYAANASSEDGETGSFEFKGTDGKDPTLKEMKNLFASEICGFANTYGGILCIHSGNRTDVQPFAKPQEHFTKLEGWLSDSLEPRLSGMLVKEVGGLFLVYIPESNTKPHRTSSGKEYKYRHGTQTNTMDEIMIGALYRSQSVLTFRPQVSLLKTGSQLMLTLGAINDSMVPGTMPSFRAMLYGFDFERTGANSIAFDDHAGRLDKLGLGSYARPHGFPPLLSVIETSSSYREQILYPKHRLELLLLSAPLSKPSPRFVIARFESFFAQCPPSISYSLFDLGETGVASPVGVFGETQETELLENLNLLRSKNHGLLTL
jgi:hypothetical protein